MRPKQADKRKLRLVLLSIISAIVVAMAAYYIIFIMPFSAPSAPRDFMSSSTDDKVMLSWAAPLSSGSSPVTNYRIYRSNSSENETFLAQVGNVSWYSDLSPSGGTYYYRISALNSAGESPKSNEVSAIPWPPRVGWNTSVVGPTGSKFNGSISPCDSIAVDSIGKSHVCYYESNSSSLIYATNSNGNWSTQIIKHTGFVETKTSIAIDHFGRLFIAYSNSSSGIPGDLAAHHSLEYVTNATGQWKGYVIDGDGGEWSSMAIDSKNEIHISYRAQGNLKVATNAGGTWKISTVDNDGDAGYCSSIAIDSNDKAHIGYYDGAHECLRYATDAGGQWNISTVDVGRVVGFGTSIALDSSNRVHLSYFDELNALLKYATNEGGRWVVHTIDAGFGYSSIAVDSHGRLQIAYTGSGRYLSLKYATNMTGHWITYPVDMADDFLTYDVGQDPSMTIDSNSCAHIVYYDGTNHNLKYATDA